MPPITDSATVRSDMVRALRLDLVGPGTGAEAHAHEGLPQAPSRWYLTGFLVPLGAPEQQRSEVATDDELDTIDEAGGSDDAVTPEPGPARRAFLPSSMGLSVLVGPDVDVLDVVVRWGDYRREGGTEVEVYDDTEAELPSTDGSSRPLWQRTPREAALRCALPAATASPAEQPVPDSGGLAVALSVRPIPPRTAADARLPEGTRAVSVFLVNRRTPAEDDRQDEAFAFQAVLEVTCASGFVPRANPRGLLSDDWDERVADLQYRDVVEFAVGHGTATETDLDANGGCRCVRTTWIPVAEVERVAAEPVDGVELGMEALADLADGADARVRLGGIVTQYRAWIEAQRAKVPAAPPGRHEIGELLLHRAEIVAGRIDAGIVSLEDDAILEAFRIANRAMAASARRRQSKQSGIEPAAVEPPAWRPFQLAFLLMSLAGIEDPSHADRKYVDLLFFPTGGGKTEAYLGLAAFTLVLRRLRNPGLASAGVAVLMRYTLRLLTLDRLSRSATRGRDEDASSRRKVAWRYCWPDEARDEVPARLLALNAEHAEQ
jgi:hypothetical protein